VRRTLLRLRRLDPSLLSSVSPTLSGRLQASFDVSLNRANDARRAAATSSGPHLPRDATIERATARSRSPSTEPERVETLLGPPMSAVGRPMSGQAPLTPFPPG